MESGKLGLRLLGPPRAYRDGGPLSFRTKKSFALLCYLAAEGGTHRREKLATLLWPESDEKKARTTLRRALADLRGALGVRGEIDDGHLLIARDSLGFESETGTDLDLSVLHVAYEAARNSARSSHPDGEARRELIARLREGSEAYRGEFLQDFYLYDAPGFDDWASLEREEWHARLVVVLESLSGLLLEDGETQEAAAVAERWTAEEPSADAAYERLMRARHALGDGTGALRVYERYRATVEGEPGDTANAPQMAALAARIGAERQVEGPWSGSLGGRTLERGLGSLRQSPPEAPLVGRAEEMGALAEEYGLASLGGARAVAVVGEAGIGKTRLVEEFLRWSTADGADVLRGDGTGAGEGVPYGPVISAIRQRLERERAPDDLLEDVWLSELGRLLPELRERYPDLPPQTADDATAKSRLFEAIVRLFEALALKATVTIFVDDLQWADAATLELLRYAARRLAEDEAPVVLVVVIREEEMDRAEDLRGWLSLLERSIPFKRLELGTLSGGDTLRVLRSLAEDADQQQEPTRELEEFGRRLHAETAGQPFFLLETIRALLDRGTLTAKPGAVTYTDAVAALEGLLPPGVRGLVRERLSRLGPISSDFLAAGAVLGDGFEFDLVRRVAGLQEGEGLSALDEALGGRVLREPRLRESGLRRGGGHSGYSFVHDKIRDVVYTDAGEARRRVFHRRSLEALEEEGAPAAELARHALAAAMGEEAFRHSVAAGEEALAVFAVEDARTHFGRARTLLEGEASGGEASRLGAPEERLRLYASLGRVHEATREWGEAHDAYERMLSEARRAGNREADWGTLHRLATLGIDAGAGQARQEDEFYRSVRRKMDEGDEGGDRRGAQSPGYEIPDDFARPLSAARARAAEALGLAREMRREDLVAQSLAALAVLEAYSGRWERVLSATEEDLSFYSRVGDRAMEGAMLNLSAWGLFMTGEPGEAVRRMRDHPGLTGEPGDQEIHRANVNGMTLALLETGDYEEALTIARKGLAAARSVGYAPRLMLNLLVFGDALRALFRLREAAEIYRETAGVVFPPEYRALVHSKLCAVAAAANWEEAHAEALLATEYRGQAAIQITEALHHHLEVEALLRGGDDDLAREQLERFGEAVGGNRRLRLAHLRARAVLGRWEGDGAAATEHLQEARGLAGEIGLPGELWQIEASLGELHGGLGNEAEARRSCSRAAEIVRRLAGGIRDRELRRRFLSASQVRCALEKG